LILVGSESSLNAKRWKLAVDNGAVRVRINFAISGPAWSGTDKRVHPRVIRRVDASPLQYDAEWRLRIVQRPQTGSGIAKYPDGNVPPRKSKHSASASGNT